MLFDVQEKPEAAMKIYDHILSKLNSKSPRAVYGKALAYDKMADQQKSNQLLGEIQS